MLSENDIQVKFLMFAFLIYLPNELITFLYWCDLTFTIIAGRLWNEFEIKYKFEGESLLQRDFEVGYNLSALELRGGIPNVEKLLTVVCDSNGIAMFLIITRNGFNVIASKYSKYLLQLVPFC